MNLIRSVLDWLGWERLSETRKRHKEIMAKLSTLGGTLTAIETTLNKVKTEVEALKNQLGDVDLPADAQATLERLSALATALDELNPDAAPEPPAEPA